MSALLSELRDGVLYVTINRPDVRNAFDENLIAELTDLFETADARAVVLAGAGKVFCAGGDLEWMRKSIHLTEQENLADARALQRMFEAIDACPCPVIGKVHGAAFGGGVGLVTVCDIVIAAEGTKFCFSEVKLGLSPAVIAPFAIAKIGASAARRYFLSAEPFDAAEAKRLGLVHEVTHADDMDQAINAILLTIRAAGPQAVKQAKALIRKISSNPAAADIADECANVIATLRVSEEGQEGVTAFLERRPPSWSG